MRICGIFNGFNGEGRGKGHLSTLAWRKIKRSIKSATYASTGAAKCALDVPTWLANLRPFLFYTKCTLLPRIRPNFACGCAFARLHQRLGKKKNGGERIRAIYDAQSRGASLTSSYRLISSLFRSSNWKKIVFTRWSNMWGTRSEVL